MKTYQSILVFVATIFTLNNGVLSFSIESHTSDQVLNEGQELIVECRSGTSIIGGNPNWKQCMWRRESDGANCLFEYKKNGVSDWVVEEYCEPNMAAKNVKFFGSDPDIENHICGINVPHAESSDNSDWTCVIEQCRSAIPFGGCSSTNGNGVVAEATMNVKVEPVP